MTSGDRTDDERVDDAQGKAEGSVSAQAPTQLAGDLAPAEDPESGPEDEKSELPSFDPAEDATQGVAVGEGSVDVDVNAPTRVVDDAEALVPASADASSSADAPLDVDAATELRGQRPVAPQSTPRGIEPGNILFGEYEIIEVLGAGGMGEVFRARHRRLDEFRAIKMMHAELSSKKGANAFFLREAKALLAVRNPAVVHCHDLLSDEAGRVYLIMEMIEGVSLSEKMQQGPLTPDEVVMLGARLSAGLKAAHDKGVVHRDISPDNIVLPGGDVAEAKLIDFGIAKILEEGEGTIVDGFKGKLSYASPEQLGFFGGKIDGRSDYYSLGLVLCAAALGRPLGMGSTVVEAVDARRSFQRVPDDIPIGLRSAIEPLLALDPADRPKFVNRLFIAPGASSASLQAISAEPARPAPSALFGGLSPFVMGGSMFVGLALLMVVAGYLLLGGEAGQAPAQGPPSETTTLTLPTPSESEPQQESSVFVAKPDRQAVVKPSVKPREAARDAQAGLPAGSGADCRAAQGGRAGPRGEPPPEPKG